MSVGQNQPVRAIEWARLGVVLPADSCADHPEDQPIDLALHLDFQGYEIVIAVQAVESSASKIERDNNERALDFTDIVQRGEELLEHFIDSLVRGRMSSVDETILCLDTPIDPITTAPDEPKEDDAKKTARPIWPLLVSGFYIARGVVVAGYIGLLVDGNFVRMEVQTAVISRLVELIEMPMDGLLVQMAAHTGAEVASGAVIMRLHDPELAQKIDQARIALSEADEALERLRKRFDIESTRLAEYRLIYRTERDMAGANVAAHEEEVQTLRRAR
ncbi:MAG: hypothetical protein AAGE80_13630 [Pseudomonadota bacterium]